MESFRYGSQELEHGDLITRASGVRNLISDSTGTLESYDFLGLDTVVRRAHSQTTLDLTYITLTASTGDAGDQYVGLDRFGRVVDQRWFLASAGASNDRFKYGYDRDGTRLYRENSKNTAFSELYAYDGLQQLTSFDRGTLNTNKDGISGTASRTQDWDYDALGNWDSVTSDGTTQTRGHNAQNEITSVSSSTTPTYDANGNLTKDETNQTYKYDAWNRVVEVKNSGGTVIATYKYDALGRRIAATVSGTTTDFYYSDQWQVLEERVSGAVKAQYVWSPVYVDALVLRDRDTDGNGSLDERLWVQQDANWNVTAIVDNTGAVVERYVYDAFGVRTIYDASMTTVRGSSSYAWVYGFQGLRLETVTGNYKTWYREYRPTLGRPIQGDPLGLGPDVNWYRWVGNGATRSTDPSGLQVGVSTVRTAVGLGPYLQPNQAGTGTGASTSGPIPVQGGRAQPAHASTYGRVDTPIGIRRDNHQRIREAAEFAFSRGAAVSQIQAIIDEPLNFDDPTCKKAAAYKERRLLKLVPALSLDTGERLRWTSLATLTADPESRSTAGRAIVSMWDIPGQRIPHFTVEVEYQNRNVHTEQVIRSGANLPTSIALVGRQTSRPTRSVEIPLPNALAAQTYQGSVLGTDMGPYDTYTNSCVTHVATVLSYGGFPIPSGTLEAIKVLRKYLEGK